MLKRACALALALSLSSAPVALADKDQDTALVEAFLQLGVIAGPDDVIHTSAEAVCSLSKRGIPAERIAKAISSTNDVTDEQAVGMAQAFISIYCPTTQKTPPSLGGRVG